MNDSMWHRGKTISGGDATPPLVGTDWLQTRLGDPDVLPVEVDIEAATYYGGHIPGAVVLDWLDELQEPRRRSFVWQQRFEALMDTKGITPNTHVLLYGDADNSYAAYAYWLLRYYRHERLSLLDGGRAAWMAAGGPLTDELPTRQNESGYRSVGPDRSIRVLRDQLLQRFVGAPPGVVLLDCRSPDEYAGYPRHPLDLPLERHRVSGHIPGAQNLPAAQLLEDDCTFRALPELRRLVEERGVTSDRDVVVYCRVGERSGLVWFVLHELLGQRRVRFYDGAWAEYGSLVDVPVARP